MRVRVRDRTSMVGVLLLALVAASCGGRQPPEPVEPAPDTTATTDTGDDEAARREAEAARLCERARAALEAGDYDTARELFRRAQSEYSGTSCAREAATALERVEAIAAIRERIHFEFDRSRITEEAAQVLQRKARALQEYPNVSLTIEGHCDERGSLEYNQALGMRRAQSAKQFLVSLGLDADRFRTVSFGEERPLVNQSTERAWSMNRRDEFVIEDMAGLNP